MSSANLVNSQLYSDRNKSPAFILKMRGPNMEPWGRPYNISNKLLKEEPTLVLERQL